MKQIILIGAMLEAGTLSTHAQAIATMIQQLGSLEQLNRTTEKGYNSVVNGLHKIGGIKNGEHQLQQAYFLSLSDISPVILEDEAEQKEIDTMVSIQNQLLDELYKALDHYKHMRKLTSKKEDDE